jgi:hypothetical protein
MGESAVKPRTAHDAFTEIFCHALNHVSEGCHSLTEDDRAGGEGLRSFSNLLEAMEGSKTSSMQVHGANIGSPLHIIL